MRNTSPGIGTANSSDRPQFRTTYGEILQDGTVIDLVADGDKLGVCYFDGTQAHVVPQIPSGNIVYQPPKLTPSLRQAIRFPSAPADYGCLRSLFGDISAVYERRGLALEAARGCSWVTVASWVPEVLPTSLNVLFCGTQIGQAAALFAVFGSICRRALTVPELTRNVPFSIRPTLLALSADKQQSFWRASNFRGVQIPRAGGAVDTFAGTRLLFVEDSAALSAWGADALRIMVMPYPNLLPPSESELTDIANEFQPKLLMFRLRRLNQQVDQTPSRQARANRFDSWPLARGLLACVRDVPSIVTSVIPLLEAQQDDLREQQEGDPFRAILESLWTPSHESGEMTVADLTKRVNAILRSRGETSDLSSKQVGWKLRQLGLRRSRNAPGKFLRFSRDLRRQLHRLVRSFQLDLPKIAGCRDCRP